MGNHRSRRAAFFSEHPFCCFCGGGVTAAEEDHIPARSLFRGRDWPEGYVFPACSACNRASAPDELVLAWLVRIRLSDYNAADERELEKALTQLNNKRPTWVSKMHELSRNETRRHLRERGLRPADFPGGEAYVLTVPDEFVAALSRYAEKLGRALYYKHTGRAVPLGGAVVAKASTNADYLAPSFPWSALQILGGLPTVTRSGKSLTDQFNYRYAVPTDGLAAGFVVQFGESTVMSILVFEDKAAYLVRRAELALQKSEAT